MASASQVSRRLADTLFFQKSSFVCRSCRHQVLRRRINLLQQSRSASDKSLPFTEKVRRKIWGTNKPSGLKDPFGGPSFSEKRRMKQEAEERGEEYLLVEEESQELKAGSEEHYIPAETWDGLEHMGHKGHWADIPPKPEDSYRPFTRKRVLRLKTREDIAKCMGRARVDVLDLEEEDLEADYMPTGAIDLQSPETFNILKRFMQLSGTRILDPMIGKSKTWEMLVDNLAKQVGPKPKNIAETLMMKENLANLPNLKIMKRRETPVDKEKEVGRLKVIQAELLARGLPKLGSSRI